MKQSKIIGYDKKNLKTYIFECEKPKGIVQIAHGLQQNSKVFFDLAKFLNNKKFIVALMDMRAHGKSCKKISDIGKSTGDTFSQTVCDEIAFSKILSYKYKKLPLYFIGFSYGSLIGQHYLKETKIAKKVLLLGSTYSKNIKFLCGEIIAKTTKFFKGENHIAKCLETNMNKYFSKNFLDKKWLTSNEKQMKEIKKDVLNCIPFSSGFYCSLFSNIHHSYKHLNQVNKNIEIGIFCGADDPFCDFGKGAYKLYQKYKKNGLNVKLNIYPSMRHCILHERNKQIVFQDILSFILS